MGQTFYIKLDCTKKSAFEKACDEIFSLSYALCKSKKLAVKEFIKDLSGPDEWIWINEKENSVSILAEKLVIIAKTDFSASKSIKYDFGKGNAARAEFICAIIVIFSHHFPGSDWNHEDMDEEDINNGIYLARLVNTAIQHPIKDTVLTPPSPEIQNIFSNVEEELKIAKRKIKLSALVQKVKRNKTSVEEDSNSLSSKFKL